MQRFHLLPRHWRWSGWQLLERVILRGLTAEVNRSTWTPGQIFKTISSVGKVSLEEMEKTFNMGVGMIAVVSPEDRERAMAMMAARHVDAWELGTIRAAGEGKLASS